MTAPASQVAMTQQEREALYRGLASKPKRQQSQIPLPEALHRHIYTFLPIETVAKIPALNSAYAVQADQQHMVARELISRSSPENPITWEDYLFCRRFGEERKIRHFVLQYHNSCAVPSSEAVLFAFIDLQESLESLRLSYLPDGDIDNLEPPFPILQNLQHLDIGGLAYYKKRIISRCPELRHLVLRGNMTAEGLKALAPHCGKLTHLSIPEGEAIRDEGIKALAPYCGNLTELDLSGCMEITDEGCKALAPYCGNLTHLALPYYTEITDEGLKALAHHCGKLTHLKIQGTRMTSITDEGLLHFISHCPHLTYLNLEDHLTYLNLEDHKITDEGLKAIAPYCKKLVYLNLALRANVDAGVKDLVSSCEDLVYLDLRGCEQLTDASALQIASSCKKLQYLNLEGCKELTDDSLKEIARNCKHLRELNLACCKELTNETVRAIIEHCPNLNLTKLGLLGCPNVTESAFATPPALSLWSRIEAAITHIFQNFG